MTTLTPPPVRRRTLLMAALGLATAPVATTVLAAPALTPASAPARLSDSAATWRVLSRLGYGPTPALVAQMQQIGGARNWALEAIESALAASHAPPHMAGVDADFNAPLPDIFARYTEEREAQRRLREAQNAALISTAALPVAMTAGDAGAMSGATPPASTAPAAAPAPMAPNDPARYSARVSRDAAAWRLWSCSRPDLENPLLARLTEFWFNHLNISADKGGTRPYVGHYVMNAIRPHVLGRFEDLLLASARHPAMLDYLDQTRSAVETTAPNGQRRGGVNENYARELMELHTLGAQGGYSQADVRELARVLTGWAQGPKQADGFHFGARQHDTGTKTVLGQIFGGSADPALGEAEGVAAIRMLAAQPATARRVALRLAQWFVADQPPKAVVDQLARSFQTSGGDLRAVMRTLVQSRAFWDPANQLFKTPYDFACSALTAAGGPQDDREVAQTLSLLQNAGQGVHRWPTPDGYKSDRTTWLAPEALTRRADYAVQLARRNPPVGFLAEFMPPGVLSRIDAQPAPLRASLLLASPDFMLK